MAPRDQRIAILPKFRARLVAGKESGEIIKIVHRVDVIIRCFHYLFGETIPES